MKVIKIENCYLSGDRIKESECPYAGMWNCNHPKRTKYMELPETGVHEDCPLDELPETSEDSGQLAVEFGEWIRTGGVVFYSAITRDWLVLGIDNDITTEKLFAKFMKERNV